jgi:V8-like Glu-specific endopeptidase
MARKAKKRKIVRAARPVKAPARTGKRVVPRPGRAGSDENIAKRKAVYDAAKDPWALPSFMAETNGGGSAEQVPGFDIFRAITSGFDSRRVAGPTTVLARPDGGFFSEGEIPPPSALSPHGSRLAKPENVMGVDNRVMVTDTSTTPWRCICHLEVEYETGPVGFGTGFLIGPKAVITAAHVIFVPGKRKARRIRVIPGRNGSSAPYGYFVTEFKNCKVPQAWLESGDKHESGAAADYAMIPIPDDYTTEKKPTAERLGYFGLKCFTDDDARTKSEMLFVNNAGYPYEADKAYGTLWYNAGRVKEMKRSFIEYMVDTEGGQSGSPVYFYDDEKKQRYVIAIHTTGDFVNRGLRITQDVFRTIKGWAER